MSHFVMIHCLFFQHEKSHPCEADFQKLIEMFFIKREAFLWQLCQTDVIVEQCVHLGVINICKALTREPWANKSSIYK